MAWWGCSLLLLRPVRTGRAGGYWPSLTRAFALRSSCGIRERAVPAARPRFPNHADLPASPAARPDGSLAAVQGPGRFGRRCLGWATAGPSSLGSSQCHVGARPLSPCLCCWAGASKQRLQRGASLPLEWVDRLPHTQSRTCPDLPSPSASANAPSWIPLEGGAASCSLGASIHLSASAHLTAAPWTTPPLPHGSCPHLPRGLFQGKDGKPSPC